MSILRLESDEAIPPEIRLDLADHTDVFLRDAYLETVLEDPTVRRIGKKLEEFLKGQRIRAYHCTKEPEVGYLQSQGLRLTDVASHQMWFVKRFGDRFTVEQLEWLQSAWDQYFIKERQAKLRNGLLWACLSRSLVPDDGCESLFRYFGSEAISKAADANAEVASVLESTGRPVVVEIALPGGTLKARYPMSYAVLSQYHRELRPDARLYESEAHWTHLVAPEDILAVTPLEEFTP